MESVSIIGAGVVGLCSALALRQAGFEVTVYDCGPAGGEASWAGAGVLSPLPPWTYPPAVQALAAYSQGLYPQWIQRLRGWGPDPELTPCGMLVLGLHGHGAARTWAQRHRATLGTLDRAALAQLEPALAGSEAALHLPEVAQVRNPRLLRALLAAARHAGVMVREHCAVHRITVEHGRVVALHTAHGNHPLQRVVLAAGAWSGQLLDTSGLPAPAVTPVRGQILLVRAAAGVLRHVILGSDGYYLVPRRDGHVLVGSTVEHVGFDRSTTVTAAAELSAAAARLVPILAGLPPVAHWAGLRPGTPDGIPYIGPWASIENLWLNAGHFRNGITLAPGSATLLTALITGALPPLDPAPYLPVTRNAALHATHPAPV